MVIKVTQDICTAPFPAIVSSNAHCRNHEHNRTDSHTQPGLVHVSLRTYTPIAALVRWAHYMKYTPVGRKLSIFGHYDW